MPCRNLLPAQFPLANPWPRESNEHNRNRQRSKHQQSDIDISRTDGDRRCRQPSQQQVEQEYLGNNLSDAKSVIGGTLIEVRSMGVPKSLAVDEPSEQGDRRISEIIERQQQGCGKMLMRCQLKQAPGGQEAHTQ